MKKIRHENEIKGIYKMYLAEVDIYTIIMKESKEEEKRNININFPGINIRIIQSQRDYQSIRCH
jgi:hypothetical protein